MPEWVDRAEELAKGYVAHLRESRGGDVDWPAVITCCERLEALYSDDRWPIVNHPPHIAHEGTGFWDETIGWLHAQLAPDQLRGLYEERIRRAAESRPSRYIFADGIWAKLSEKARDELITADSTWMADGSENRLATILNPVQRATEDTLYHLFWVPIMHWARGRDEEYGWLSSLLGNRNFPRLTDYLWVLSSPTSITYFLVQPGAQGRVATGLLLLPVAEHAGGSRAQGFFPGLNLAGMGLVPGPGTWTWYLAASWATVSSSFTASRATLALNAGLCFLRHLDISHSSLAATAALSLGAGLSLSYLSSFPGPPHPFAAFRTRDIIHLPVLRPVTCAWLLNVCLVTQPACCEHGVPWGSAVDA